VPIPGLVIRLRSADAARDQDKVIGKGPAEKAGKNIDEAVKELTK